MKSLRLGTRGSKLALWQAEHVAKELRKSHPDLKVELQIIKTTGDKIIDVALSKIGDKGLFTKEIEKELLEGRIDLAVHSMKDLPTQLEKGLCVGAVLQRENPADVLISHQDYTFENLPIEARIGTSSLRRIAQLKKLRPDLVFVEIRGNVETRIRKMHEENLNGIILAYAGVKRLGMENVITQVLSYETILPAVGQGIIAIEARQEDTKVLSLLQKINDKSAYLSSQAERAFLRELEGGCQVPIASLAEVKDDRISMRGLIASLDGSEIIQGRDEGSCLEAELLGQKLARSLLDQGGARVLGDIRQAGGQDG
ncbi:MAG: hydroxymethylbilane synthase [Syntrophomonadaceae bacterium]|nr:hydroxymethylbilane synthase [Syntrophomonadaceae bacterium]MDD3023469.1 hydroxymethylbilane synthase [Syntrophomonadaceae bacterium]